MVDRGYRLWRQLRTVLNHDLPNQVVVVHGLLQLLRIEEEERLSPEGKDYLSRSEAACKRTLESLGVLKKIIDLDCVKILPETLSVDEFLREVSAASRQSLGASLEIVPPPLKTITIPCVALQQALLQLIVAVRGRAASSVVQLAVKAGTGQLEFWIGTAPLETAGVLKPVDPGAAKSVENRLALLYVQELAEAWGGTLYSNAPESTFVVSVPSPA